MDRAVTNGAPMHSLHDAMSDGRPEGGHPSDRPIGSGRKAWVVGLAAVTTVLGLVLGFWLVSSLGTDSTRWVTVTEVDGVRFAMPRLPHHEMAPVPGTDVTMDLYQARFDDIELGVAVVPGEPLPGDTRTDAQVLDDSADGAAMNIGGTIVDSRDVEVDGAPGRDLEITTPQQGGGVVLARIVLTDDLLVMVETVFDPTDREAATATHDRMARSIDFDGEEAGTGAALSELNGVYRVEWTVDELVAAGVSENIVSQYGLAGVHTWSLDDGRLRFSSEFHGGSSLVCSGTYETRGLAIDLHRRSPCAPGVLTAGWELTDAGLVLTRPRLDGQRRPELDVWMSQKPWARVE